LPVYGNAPERPRGRREVTVAGIVLILAFSAGYISERSQQMISAGLQVTILRPFIATQERFAGARQRVLQVDYLTAELDSLSAILLTQSTLLNENRTLRSLLELVDRPEQRYIQASVLRPGTPGSESMFLLDVGADEGVSLGAAVVSPHGLVGVILEVRGASSVGIDWSHPEFRASAMVVDGTTYGLVEPQRGRFREEDRLVLNGIAYHHTVVAGVAVVTSGLGGVLPRGIPIGRVGGLADAEGGWRKSYFLRPMVAVGSATHVLVLTGESGDDISDVWANDSLTREEDATRGPGS
jgi:rod shape-determining protein MreC